MKKLLMGVLLAGALLGPCHSVEAAQTFSKSDLLEWCESHGVSKDDGEYQWSVFYPYDKNQDGVLNAKEVAKVDVVNVVGGHSTDAYVLQNLEKFKNLTGIAIIDPDVKTLSVDFSKFKKLKELIVGLEDFKGSSVSVNVDDNSNLETLTLGGKAIKKVSFSGAKKLNSLVLSGVSLESLDFSKNTSLESIFCEGETIKNLELGNNKKLSILYCNETKLKIVDISGCPSIDSLVISNSPLKSLKLGTHKKMKGIILDNTKIKSLDTSGFRELSGLSVYGTKIKKLDVSKNPKLELLYTDKDCKVTGASSRCHVEYSSGLYAM